MLLSFIRFELQYRLRRPATYLYALILFLLAFAGIAWENVSIGGAVGLVKDNAPTVLANMMVIVSVIPGLFIVSALMGVPVLRDNLHRTSSIIYATPIRKQDYLLGRFLGSFLVVLFVFLCMVLGFMLGTLFIDPDRALPFHLWHFLQPFLIFVLPNLFISSALFFAGGTLSRKLLFVFVQGILLLSAYIISSQMTQDLDNEVLSGLLDPFSLNTKNIVSQYWTVAEQNNRVYPLSGLILHNRILWLAIGCIALGITFHQFSFSHQTRRRWWGKRKSVFFPATPPQASVQIPQTFTVEGQALNGKRIWNLSRLYFWEIFQAIPFIAISAVGILMLVINMSSLTEAYGTQVYPSTYRVLERLSQFNFFFIIIVIFYTGELIWRERDLKMNQIYDTLPISNPVSLLSKYLGLVYIYLFLLGLLLFTGVLIQTLQGYHRYQFDAYIKTLFGEQMIFLLLYTVLGFFIHILVNQKYLGHTLMILIFIFSNIVLGELGMEHNMLRYGSGSLGIYSDMNEFGHFVIPFSWYQVYWVAFALVLFAICILFTQRGTELLLSSRLRLAQHRLSRPLFNFGIASLLIFIFSGSYIYYNNNVLNEYTPSARQDQLAASYEKTLKTYEGIPQPKIVAIDAQVDLFPYDRDMEIRGSYILKNKTPRPISEIHLQHYREPNLKVNAVTFDREAALADAHTELGYFIYQLPQSLAPGDSLQMNFSLAYLTQGFEESTSSNEVVYNGTYISQEYFPALGYNAAWELTDLEKRNKYGLARKNRLKSRENPEGKHTHLGGDDADRIRFEIQLSTEADQIALAPGYLHADTIIGDRRHFHYQMDVPMLNLFSIVSARYEVMREPWKGPDGKEILLEIYYHPTHTYNLDRMMRGMKAALGYYIEHFGPYQYRQMRIMEFPRYRSFAASFANTVPFSEGLGFVMRINDDSSIDMPFYVTAHEMAHQWWAHQVTAAQVQGGAVLSETLSQYAALMVMKHTFPPEMVEKFLEYELDLYLKGRRGETHREQPLARVENQAYIHYRKGSLAMFALQDYISEDSVNAALRRLIADWAWREDSYPTTHHLIDYFREVTPDSLQGVIDDLFEHITLFENRVTSRPSLQRLEQGYLVQIPVSVRKYRADSLGNEQQIPLNDWIDVGVFGTTAQGNDTLLYLEKHKFSIEEAQIRITVDQLPSRAGIDPLHKLIDRNPDDNVLPVRNNNGTLPPPNDLLQEIQRGQ